MIALVRFDSVLKKDEYEALKDVYDFGVVTDRVKRDYYDRLVSMASNEYFSDEVVEKVVEGEKIYYSIAEPEKRVQSYDIHPRKFDGYIGIEKTDHVVELEELYTLCRKIQVRILEVAKIK